MQGKGAGPVNRVELESQVLCAALRQSCNVKEKIGAFTSVRELSHLFPDLLPPPEKDDQGISATNKANYYDVIGVKPQSAANGVVAAYLRTARSFIRQNKVTDRRQEYSQILNAGFILRKPRLRLSHDLVVARRWLHEESRLAQIAQQEVTIDNIDVKAVQKAVAVLSSQPADSISKSVDLSTAASASGAKAVPSVSSKPAASVEGPPPLCLPPVTQPAPFAGFTAQDVAAVPTAAEVEQRSPDIVSPAAVSVPPMPPLPYYDQPEGSATTAAADSQAYQSSLAVGEVRQSAELAPAADAPAPIELSRHLPASESGTIARQPVIPPAVLSAPPPAKFDPARVSTEAAQVSLPEADPDEDASEFDAPDLEPASVRARAAAAAAEQITLSQAAVEAARPSGRIGKQAAFVFDEGALRRPQAANKPIPMVIQLLEAAQIIGSLEVEALKAQMEFAPNIPVEKLILNAGYISSQELASIKLGESLLQQGRITMAQFQVAIYDERVSGLRMAESLQVRGWLSVEVRNAIDDWHRKRS